MSMAFPSANYSGNGYAGGGSNISRAGGVVGAEEEEEGEEQEENKDEEEEDEEEEEDDDIVHVETAVKIVAFVRRMTANVGCALLMHRPLLSVERVVCR